MTAECLIVDINNINNCIPDINNSHYWYPVMWGSFHETEAEAELTRPRRGKAEAEAGGSRPRQGRGRMFEAEASQ